MPNNGVTVSLIGVSKTYQQTHVISAMDLTVNAGEFLVLLGPSGCGKSTTLRMIAGLESISAGQLLFDGEDAQGLACGKRQIAMVFQDYALYPNMTVRQNIEYAARVHKHPKASREAQATEIMTTLGLSKYADRRPAALSGGQKQRVALGRGLAKHSKLFLLDEPLSNIDVQLREAARDGILRLHEASGQTIIYVTHDQQEAMALGDRVAVINEGKIQMIDTPSKLYHEPANLFVATFIGTPAINLFTVQVQGDQLVFAETAVATVQPKWGQLSADQSYQLGVRSEYLTLHDTKPEAFALAAQVQSVTDYGRFYQVSLVLADGMVVKATTAEPPKPDATTQYITLDPAGCLLFDPDTGINLAYSLEV